MLFGCGSLYETGFGTTVVKHDSVHHLALVIYNPLGNQVGPKDMMHVITRYDFMTLMKCVV